VTFKLESQLPFGRCNKKPRSCCTGSHSVILDQVTYGIAVRMAVMSMTLGRDTREAQA